MPVITVPPAEPSAPKYNPPEVFKKYPYTAAVVAPVLPNIPPTPVKNTCVAVTLLLKVAAPVTPLIENLDVVGTPP